MTSDVEDAIRIIRQNAIYPSAFELASIPLTSLVDSYLVVIGKYVTEHARLDLLHGHSVSRDTIKQFLLQRSEEALHPGIVIAMRDAAEALRETHLLQCLAEPSACILTAAVAVQDRTSDRIAVQSFDRVHTQFLLHVVPHDQREDLAVVAIQDWRDIQLSVPALNLSNVRQQLFVRFVSAEILFEKVF